MSDLLTYVSMLFGAEPIGAFAETRKRLRDGGMGQDFYAVDDLSRLARLIEALGRDTDLYVGVAPRARQEGRRDAVKRVHAVWADCDEPQAIAALEDFEPAPSMVVNSGRGRHVYWSLFPPVGPGEAERANRQLAAALGADKRATDAARILRPPGTFNWKSGEPVPVTVESTNVEVYAVKEVVGAQPDPVSTSAARAPRLAPQRTDDPLERIPPGVYFEALTGLVPDASGKVACPLHEDATPSLHVYEDPERGWYCYGCEQGGRVYQLAAILAGYPLPLRGADFLAVRDVLLDHLAVRAAA